VNTSRKVEIGKRKRRTFTVAKVRLFPYLIVNLAKKKKTSAFFISSVQAKLQQGDEQRRLQVFHP
jgi:hypothetical protein